MAIDVVEVDLGPGVLAGFTGRAGGRSRGPWSGLNLALHVEDAPADVEANREVLAGWAGSAVTFVRQVHGRTVHVADGRDGADRVEADAVVASAPGRAVGVLVADCVPVLLADADAGVAAAVHAGWRGVVAGVLDAAVDRLLEFGARPDGLRAAIGPAAGGCCYEVGDDVRERVLDVTGEAAAVTRTGRPALDLRAGCAAVLAGRDVRRVVLAGGCTVHDPRWYSYRRDGRTGRCAGVVRVLPR